MPLPNPTEADLKRFASWLKLNQELPGADVLLQHHLNTGIEKQNRTGHFKQTFCACCRFFHEYPSWRQQLAIEAPMVGAGGLNLANHAVLNDWRTHVATHAADTGSIWSYRNLMEILAPGYGGTRTGGGGGSGTLQRMLPLLAKYMTDRGLG